MKTEYSVFKKYSNLDQAKEIQELLERNDIITNIGDNVGSLDATIIGGNQMLNQIEIRIKQSDFEKANRLLDAYFQVTLDKIDKDYYLLEFSDKELYDILLKPDEWGNIDYILAKQLLEKRGKSIDNEMLNSLKEQRINDLAKPDENQTVWIIVGYFLALIGGLLGIIIGYLLMSSKKTLPNGVQVYSYNAKDRKHGKVIFIIGIIVIAVSASIKIFDLVK